VSRWSKSLTYPGTEGRTESLMRWEHPDASLTLYTKNGDWYARSHLWSGALNARDEDEAKRQALTKLGKAAKRITEAAREALRGNHGP